MKVKSTVHVYQVNGESTKVGSEPELFVRNVWNRKNLVELQINDGMKVAVHFKDLIKAINNAVDNEL